ncbi:hypothetical protein [Lentzea sp. CA-135723]|uniref:hypothetical protein n=1 Tax=Lentzea sp. CA-135723 TaxID=3239950 RepID=UPI003D908B38
MNSQRLAFLDDLEAELSAPGAGGQAAGSGTGVTGRKIRHLAATLLASASFFTVSAGVASAGTGSDVVASDCMRPDYVNYTHTKKCGALDIQKFEYRYSYSPNQVLWCHVFWHYSFTCNTWYYIGVKEAC